MPTTCIITGYKLGAGTIIVYGFILSGTVFNPPSSTPTINTTETSQNETTKSDDHRPTEATPNITRVDIECGVVSRRPFGLAKSLDLPISRLLLSMMTKRILGGTETNEGDWPWMVYLYEKIRGRVNGFICGGALINERWTVTAAHCISHPNSPELYGVILGEHSSSEDSSNEKEFDLSEIVRHSDFFKSSLNNDITLLKLAETVTFTRYIRPVCLVPAGFPTDATQNQEFNGNSLTYAGTICTVLGWGQTAKKNRTDIMQQLNVIILPHLLCESVTSNPSEPYQGRSVEKEHSKFCAGGSLGEDTCAGDSGGPLLCIHDDGRYYLHGVTSYGTVPCGQKNKPGIYTRVTDFYDWIMNNVD